MWRQWNQPQKKLAYAEELGEGKPARTTEETWAGPGEMGNPSDQEQLSSPVPNQEDQVAVLLQNAFLPLPS